MEYMSLKGLEKEGYKGVDLNYMADANVPIEQATLRHASVDDWESQKAREERKKRLDQKEQPAPRTDVSKEMAFLRGKIRANGNQPNENPDVSEIMKTLVTPQPSTETALISSPGSNFFGRMRSFVRGALDSLKGKKTKSFKSPPPFPA